MGPKRLSSICKPNTSVSFGPGAIERYPILAAKILRVIAQCSEAEFHQYKLFAGALKTNAVIATKVLNSIISIGPKNTAIFAALQETMNEDELKTYELVMRIKKRVTKHRDRFAHHRFGASAELPNAYILWDPRDHLSWKARSTQRSANAINNVALRLMRGETEWEPDEMATPPDRSKMWVYYEKDLDNIISEAGQVSDALFFLEDAFTEAFSKDRMHGALKSLPIIQQAQQPQNRSKDQ